jgi:hypothetical protein
MGNRKAATEAICFPCLRESYRDRDKFKKRTLANLSDWPAAKIEALRRELRDEAVAPTDHQALTLLRNLPHGHVAAALGCFASWGSTASYRKAAGNLAARWRCAKP